MIRDRIKEITEKIKSITMSPEEQANEQKYEKYHEYNTSKNN